MELYVCCWLNYVIFLNINLSLPGDYEKDPRAEEIRQIQGVHAAVHEPSVEEPIFEEDEREGDDSKESEEESEGDAEDSEKEGDSDDDDNDDEEEEEEGCSAFVSNKFALLDSCDWE